MDRDELQERTKQFALRVIRLVDALPPSVSGRSIASQLVRCGTSVAANYRAARRGRSRKEFAAKIGLVVEEIDESLFWLELIRDYEMFEAARIDPLIQESEELLKIFAKTRRTTLSKSPLRQITTSPETP